MMNNYVFIRVVGKGSYGEVNLVTHKSDRKQYVIKKLNLTTSSKRERRAAEQEAQLLSQLRHPNIVTYKESWEGDDRQLYIVMGFCEGGDLYHKLKQQKGELLPEKQVVEWFVQIAMALQYLHERNILHRDLKTQNIFLTKNNIIKVGDLGIARVLENQNDMASTLIGTPYYMSPELFSNKPYNHKSDVWALGCCVYEMSTLKHAFNAKDMNSLVYRIVEGKLPQMPSRYDSQLGDLIKSMLCKRPEDRPDVKLILRQPYIKKQIAMFLEATKEKTAKSRKKAVTVSGDSRVNCESVSAASVQPKPERQPPSPQSEPHVRVKRREEKQHHKVSNGITDCTPVQKPPPPKPPSPDAALHCSSVSMATVSNINIDVPQQESERPTQKPPTIVPRHRAVNDHGTHGAHKDTKGRGKPDPSPSRSPAKPPSMSVSGVNSRAADERQAPNGSLDIRPKATSRPGDTFPVFVEKQMSDVDDKDDTMELLQGAEMQEPELEVEKGAAFSPTHKSNAENSSIVVEEANVMDDKKDTLTIFKGTPALHILTSDIQNLESTEKLLEPFTPALEPEMEETPQQFSLEPSMSHSKAAAPRPLPPPPAQTTAVEARKKNKRNIESKKTDVAVTSASVNSCKKGLFLLPQDRPLSARERRRLRQSQESPCQPALSSGVDVVRRASYDVSSTKTEHSLYHPFTRSVSDIMTGSNTKQEKSEQRSDDDECSSSTSSTERSEGDCRERKTESCEMQDLVHMMTQTLRMDVGDHVNEVDKGRFGSTALPEFKLNRKYRDTLVLHGKTREEAENFSLGEIPMDGSTSGPAKIRRAIEQLRTDVVKGLGVKLLDRVLEIMEKEEEDDTKRELRLRDQMGDEKYQAYAVMVRQLKFFEDIAFKV
ncbi:serine serine/threonine-protein kinase Nek4 [Solea senegalensis]|uniref:Serine/threonine-protein kinase Nek4 n=2 Tax=Solea senegalensis TaxID=28829 RepID=A0AAV6QRY6_SOLSE|nr:serine/threonine-protein kinase Nek4 [Solea senegalensis]KAG7494998.1 serine serine/threonine-protein kinase Nek4 [Solea senegalensis]